MEKKFEGFTIHCIDRNKNEEANALTQPAARGDPMPSNVFFQVVEALVVRELDDHKVASLIMTEDWRAPITLYLQGHYHPTDEPKSKKAKILKSWFHNN